MDTLTESSTDKSMQGTVSVRVRHDRLPLLTMKERTIWIVC